MKLLGHFVTSWWAWMPSLPLVLAGVNRGVATGFFSFGWSRLSHCVSVLSVCLCVSRLTLSYPFGFLSLFFFFFFGLHLFLDLLILQLQVCTIRSKKKTHGTEHHVIPWIPRSLAGLPSFRLSGSYICYIYNVQSFSWT